MKKILVFASVLLSSFGLMANDLRLWYREPALKWEEALPLGNARLGAMVFGGIKKDEIQLNEINIWGGGPHNNNSTKSLDALPDIRKLIFEGKNKEAENLINATFKTGKNGMPYQTAGSLFLTFLDRKMQQIITGI